MPAFLIPSNPASHQFTVDEYIDDLNRKGWIAHKARVFHQFSGFLKNGCFDSARITKFLRQFEDAREVYLVCCCLDFVEKNYWNANALTDLFVTRIRPQISWDAKRKGCHNIFFVDFGNSRDSSLVIGGTALKDIEERYGPLHDFLSQSRSGNSGYSPNDTAICFFDDNFVRAVQASAMLKQWMGYRTPEEETHVQPLPDELKDEFRKYELIYATVVGTHDGANKLDSTAASLGLQLTVLAPILYEECVNLNKAFKKPEERQAVIRVLKKYGKDLFQDKVGRGWNTAKREESSLGYDGRGLLFLFYFQMATAVPAIFWRSGVYKGKEWVPLFPRSSDFERFCTYLGLQDDYEAQPVYVRRIYRHFVNAQQRRFDQTGEVLTYDQKRDLFSRIREEVTSKKEQLSALEPTFWLNKFPPPVRASVNCTSGVENEGSPQSHRERTTQSLAVRRVFRKLQPSVEGILRQQTALDGRHHLDDNTIRAAIKAAVDDEALSIRKPDLRQIGLFPEAKTGDEGAEPKSLGQDEK